MEVFRPLSASAVRAHVSAGAWVLVLALVFGCTSAHRTPGLPDLQASYRRAIADAEVAEPEEVCRTLTAVTPDHPALQWRDRAGARRVLAVTWTSWDGYDREIGREMELGREVWVTLVPELSHFCRSRPESGEALTLRVEQLLGLPPGVGKSRFVELWVAPGDLFRPAPDPEIDDRVAEWDVRRASVGPAARPGHFEWFERLRGSSYGENGYPWTRLGYTYDWGNPAGEVGLSEFVVRAGATVGVEAVTPTQEYLGRHRPRRR